MEEAPLSRSPSNAEREEKEKEKEKREEDPDQKNKTTIKKSKSIEGKPSRLEELRGAKSLFLCFKPVNKIMVISYTYCTQYIF